MKEKTKETIALAGIVFVPTLSLVLFGVNIGLTYAEKRERQKAIEANVGRWTVNAETGDKQFVYGIPSSEATGGEGRQ